MVLFEAENRLGGHARTVIAGKNGDQPVDTGFIVFNKTNYPHLVDLFDALGTPITESSMSFGVSAKDGRLEYGLASVDAVFAQRRRLMHPAFLRMIRDILTFNKRAEAVVTPEMTIRDLIGELRLGPWFARYYLTPFSGAIWSTPKLGILDFPAAAMVRFFRNHGILDWNENHQWYTVKGGSIQYVSRLQTSLENAGVDIRLNAGAQSVRRGSFGVEVRTTGDEWEHFDDVVFATHADQTLAMLSDPTDAERAALGAIRYQPNRAILHSDITAMPKRRKVWSSWSHVENGAGEEAPIALTYWMNALQPIPDDDPMFVTLNDTGRIRDEAIYDEATFHHPVFDLAAVNAQGKVRGINGQNRTWFCGAWMQNGFHEDGLASAFEVAKQIDAQAAMDLTAE